MRRALAILALSALASLARPAAADVALEYQVKAGLLFNFLLFIQWPDQLLPAGEDIDVCVFGDAAFGDALSQLDGQMAHDHKLRLRRLDGDSGASLAGCELIFMPRGLVFADRVLSDIAGQPVLTVGEGADFARSQGVIGLVVRDNRVRFEINQGRGRAAGLVISSQLLRLADQVHDAAEGAP